MCIRDSRNTMNFTKKEEEFRIFFQRLKKLFFPCFLYTVTKVCDTVFGRVWLYLIVYDCVLLYSAVFEYNQLCSTVFDCG